MTSAARFIVSTVALLLGPVLTASCGPSVQSIYEGDVRFEHCYRLDLELDVATTHRQACWTTWLDRYTYGQSRDRLEYARRRVRAFASGDTDRPALRVGASQEEDTRQFYLVVPSPTSVHAPPPPIATRVNTTLEPPASSATEPSKSTPAISNSAEPGRSSPTISNSAEPSRSSPTISNSAEPGRPRSPAVPGEDCASACKSAFTSCNQACDPTAKSGACKSCDPDYKKCMARCFD